MRHHLSTLLVTGSLLLSLTGCAADSRTSSSAPPSTTQIAQAEGKDQPLPGAVQEPSIVQPPPGTELPPPPTAASEPAQTPQGEPQAGEIQERGVIAPSGPTAPPSRITQPGLRYVGPTDNITKVANAIQVFTKGLTSLVRVAPNLALTQPVTMSVGYYSRCSGNRVTQVYQVGPTFSLNFFDQDAECDGKPREMDIDTEFSEPKAGGGVYSYALPVSKIILDPLYDVKIDPLRFVFHGDCGFYGTLGLSDTNKLTLSWLSPDHQQHNEALLISSGQQQVFNDFVWFGDKVSASANLSPPLEWFSYEGIIPCALWPPCAPFVHGTSSVGVPPPNLVPGKTHTETANLQPVGGGSDPNCSATVTYNIWYSVHRFSLLELTGQPI